MIEVSYDVIPEYQENRKRIKRLNFESVPDPMGGGTIYPLIAKSIPYSVARAIDGAVKGFCPEAKCVQRFARKSPEGVPKPHDAHTDLSLGEYTAILYLYNGEGTSFVSHTETGLYRTPCNDQEQQVWLHDQSNRNKWNEDLYCPAVENKMLLFDADLMHRSEPEFGSYGRLVVVSMYEA